MFTGLIQQLRSREHTGQVKDVLRRRTDSLGCSHLYHWLSKKVCSIKWQLQLLLKDHKGVQGWHIGESIRLPPMWPGSDSYTRRHMWVEFVGSLLCTERFSPGTPVFPSSKTNLDLI